jgi:hypothetical protein
MDQGSQTAALAMKWLAPNIGRTGRIVRGLLGIALIIAGLVASRHSSWLCILLIGFGVFGLFEAARGWCFARACGIKTRL